MIATEKLNDLIEYFIQHEQANIYKDLDNYRDVYMAARAKGADGKKHPHQHRISPTVLDEFARKIASQSDRFAQARSFDGIYSIVESCKIYKIGPLALYDTAVRIGHIYNIEPQEVYLQRGALWGASALGIHKSKASKQEFTAITPVFSRLTPHEIECFLCLHHKQLRAMRQP